MPCSAPTRGHITKLAVAQISSKEPNWNPMVRESGGVELEVAACGGFFKGEEIALIDRLQLREVLAAAKEREGGSGRYQMAR